MRATIGTVAAVATIVSATVTLTGSPAGAAAGFGDVPPGSFYAAAVQWMDDEELTTGTSPGCFSPDRAVTRGEFATFLWRHAGRPAATTEPFDDVGPGDFFRTSAAWMAATGITTGTSPTTFSPHRAVTRGEAATFLWRNAGRPAAATEPFDDVGPGDFFRAAVAWMAATGITTGTSSTTFSPHRAVTRGEAATFLWRNAGQPSVEVEPGGRCGDPQPGPAGDGDPVRFETRPVGAALPSGAWCASRVRPAPETRPSNRTWNQTRGTSANDRPGLYGRVDGDFTGTTDEIIQWAACKWGIDEDIARAQIAVESYWWQGARGDLTTDADRCHPAVRTAPECPESVGLGQVKYEFHREAFEDANAIESSAYNVDYTYAIWRDCYEGNRTWLNDVTRGATYTAGDLWGCVGVWFAGRWYANGAVNYIDKVRDWLGERVWESAPFLGYEPPSG